VAPCSRGNVLAVLAARPVAMLIRWYKGWSRRLLDMGVPTFASTHRSLSLSSPDFVPLPVLLHIAAVVPHNALATSQRVRLRRS
jgi:hypothetical protein